MKKIVVLVMVLALAFPLSACSKNQDINQNLMEQVQLDDAEMKDALVELTERLQAQMRTSDPEAKAELKVSEEGNCVVVITPVSYTHLNAKNWWSLPEACGTKHAISPASLFLLRQKN